MICVIALIVFSILSIFSVRYRSLTKEAFDCVFRKVTFRKCRTNLDERIRGQVSGKLIRRNPAIGRIVFKHFSIISWIFVIITIVSLLLVVNSGYNWVRYGNCNGQGSEEFCIFDGLIGDEAGCEIPGCDHSCDCTDTTQCSGCTKGCDHTPYGGEP